MTADPNAHPAVLIVTALVGAGLLKSLEKGWSAWLRSRKSGASDPRTLQGWLVTEVKFLRQDLAEQRKQLSEEREAHKQCRIDLARLEERLIGLHDEVRELREERPVGPGGRRGRRVAGMGLETAEMVDTREAKGGAE